MRSNYSLFRICLLLFTFSSTSLHATELATAAPPKVVVSITPLAALVSAVMQGVAEPTLLLDSTQSPHHTSLRPSQMRALNQADLVFWIGPQLEAFLPRVLRALSTATRTVALLDTPQLHTLRLRNAHDHAAVEPGQQSAIDPHIWLSTANTRILVAEITAQLSRIDPARAAIYRANAQQLQNEITALHAQLKNTFKAGGHYLSYHDGYQYFEEEFGLHHAGSVSQNEELQPSPGHIRALRQRIAQEHITCIVYDAPLRPALINTLLQGNAAKAVELDALGLRQVEHPNHAQNLWLNLMRALASDFSRCLSAQSSEN